GLVAASVVRRRNELEAERRALEAQRPSALLATERERLGFLLDRATDALTGRLARERVILERLGARASTTLRLGLGRARFDIATAQGGLAALSPFATLERGYAIVRTPDGTVVRDATTVRVDDALEVRLAAGGLDVRVERVRDSMG
ncbi:MAG: exodeoxyribonuclease VII large subunit, partial [Candidatus Limnocylindrales bacterium]